ncbi:ABC transporter permease subunit [Streptomyces sp. SLBN-31]|uniref:ABC transporter permease subunit n=1 Tax=Streptomyces sp. SLBN-31 TaxID=2768444 RepID=UPI0011539FC6|nr:ATP-binding cassette domain-containing protein [Streptomyces sp. SLBN-31]TQJ87082.1 ABC-type branched-subunit amino acid transport system ATPase component [Streptomyces sp. SLBN-31]
MSSLTYDLTLAGLSVGSAAALTGIGLIVTYRATGVLNFAHGAIAMVCAYALRQCVVEWGWPLWPAAALTLVFLAPAIGVALERLVFRPLAVLGGDPAQTLVASIGVFVLLVGGAALLWGQGARDDAPELVSADPWGQLAVVLVLAAGVGAVIRWTRFGRELRAVVDDRRLAVLGGIDADRVAAAGWAFGSFTAGLTGVLLAPYVRLDPYGLPLLVMEVVAVAVAARMRSLPVAVLVALGVGVAQSQLTRLHPAGWGGPLLQTAGANLFVVALLVAALALPRVGRRDALPRTAGARVPTPPGAWIVAVALFLLPLGFAGSDLHTSVQVPALGVVLLSLVVVTGRGGQISLGQAAYAGLGALFTALLAAGRFPGLPRLPELAALAVSVALVAPLGLLTGWPAISRRGLALALATFAVGVGVSRFVFAQPYATSDLGLGRPAGFDGDRAYYVLELVLLFAALLATRALRRGRTGRALAAMRDHEAGASAAGVRVPSLKLLAFVAGAALAALGGGMLGMGLRAFDPGAYDPVRGLLWFAAVMVLGADSTLGALAAAALLVGLDAGARGGVAAALIGVLAVLIGRFPGGPYEAWRTATQSLRSRRPTELTQAGAAARARLTPSTGLRVPAGATTTPGAGTGRRGTGNVGARVAGGAAARVTGDVAAPAAGDAAAWVTGDAAASAAGDAAAPATEIPAPPPAKHPAPPAADDPTTPAKRGAAAPAAEIPAAPAGEERETPPGEDQATPPAKHPAPPAADDPTTPAKRGAAAPAAEDAAPAAGKGLAPAGEDPAACGSVVEGLVGARGRSAASGAGRPSGVPARAGGRRVGPVVLAVRRLQARYGGFTALDDVGLDAHAGQVTAVIGPNGAGKSTLFHCLAGTLRPAHGQVLLADRDITRLPAHTRTRLGIARTFQQLAVFPSLTVAENVRVGAEQGRVADPGAVDRALRLFGLDGPLGTLPAAALPTGTLRRVELARALAGSPRVLLLDEPAAGLDSAEVAAMAGVLKALAADGTALLVVEHDLDLVADLADVVHVMAAGRIVAVGPPDRVLDEVGP